MSAPHLISHNGDTRSVSGWARHIGIKPATLSKRLREGFGIALALLAPVGTTRRGTRFGEGCVRADGYRILWIDGKAIMEHVLIVERAIGRKLKGGEEVHHFNEVRSDNRHENLVVCPDHRYHELLHMRSKALAACGNASHRLCKFCGEYDDPEKMFVNNRSCYHRACGNAYKRAYRQSRKEK